VGGVCAGGRRKRFSRSSKASSWQARVKRAGVGREINALHASAALAAKVPVVVVVVALKVVDVDVVVATTVVVVVTVVKVVVVAAAAVVAAVTDEDVVVVVWPTVQPSPHQDRAVA
jgi:hypothetical protein